MASESSSAVLELNDADDTEDTDISVLEQEPVPLIMDQGYDIAVKVDAPMKQLSTLETYVTYRVRCVCARWATPPHVRRRYNHFKLLHKRLAAAHPLLAAPALPPLHSARQQLDRYATGFVAVRTVALHCFLTRVAQHPILTHCEDFRLFLTIPDEDFDKVFKNENSALNLWGLSSSLYSSGEAKSTNGARVKDPEFSSAADYLLSLQNKLTTLCTLTTKLYKGSAALENELMGMKRCCDAWCSSERGAVALACAACARGAHGASCARGASRHNADVKHRALAPLLAEYASAQLNKIRQRDQMHTSLISGDGNTAELQNRLAQASEALRSDLSDWTPKTRAEIKALLLNIAETQTKIHAKTKTDWEQALAFATQTDVFETVSKQAVKNLSPSKVQNEIASDSETNDSTTSVVLDDDIRENDINFVDSIKRNSLDEANTNGVDLINGGSNMANDIANSGMNMTNSDMANSGANIGNDMVNVSANAPNDTANSGVNIANVSTYSGANIGNDTTNNPANIDNDTHMGANMANNTVNSETSMTNDTASESNATEMTDPLNILQFESNTP